MCPVTDEYINNEYEDSGAVPVRVDGVLEQELIQAGRKILALVRKGHPFIFPDVLKIEKALLNKPEKENGSLENNNDSNLVGYE